jgi:poly(A) polymerase
MASYHAASDPRKAREFAVEVVRRLRAAGYEALWAGGCVRDQLLGGQPKDYDVATSATPDQVRELFGHRKTLAIGASFGVITVLGPKAAGPIEVATFRCDVGYSDGRHPDRITFSSAEEDAQRRDFTINGLFYDPLTDQVIDYVGGQEDLRKGIIRAIREPRERFTEDKLRMLRAVRFAATFGFSLDPATLEAIRAQAHEVVIVSAERIAAELRRMFIHSNRAIALRLLYESQLLSVILPEARVLDPDSDAAPNETPGAVWRRTLAILQRLEQPAFATALAAVLREIPSPERERPITPIVGERWRLSNDEIGLADWILASEPLAGRAHLAPWPVVQRLLIAPGAAELVKYIRAVEQATGMETTGADFCARKLALPPSELNPPPLVTGQDLKTLGLRPGPQFKRMLDEIRDAQLEGRVRDQAAALELARKIAEHT